MKDKTTAAVLAFFLGGFGVHRFYLGQTGLGIVYLLLVLIIVSPIIALIDAIIFFTMDQKAFDKKYNNGKSSSRSTSSFDGSASDELDKLFSLKEKGAITEQEYQLKKSKLLQ